MSDDLKWVAGGCLLGMRAMAPAGTRLSVSQTRKYGVLTVSVTVEGKTIGAEVAGCRFFRWLDSPAADWDKLLEYLRKKEAAGNGGLEQLNLFDGHADD